MWCRPVYRFDPYRIKLRDSIKGIKKMLKYTKNRIRKEKLTAIKNELQWLYENL